MVRIFQLDFLDRQDRLWAGEQAGQALRLILNATPKRALTLYGAILIALMLWLVPIRYRFKPWASLTFTLMGAGLLAMAQNQLEAWQTEIEEQQDTDDYERALHRQTIESVQTTQQYTRATAARLSASDVLPNYLMEPDLVDPKVAKQADFEEFKQLMGVEESSATKQALAPALIAGDHNGDGNAPKAKESYRFYQRKNPQSKKNERCVDLAGHRYYAGLPIVDLALEMAKESRSCLGVGPTGTGKSQLLKQAIAAQHRIDMATDFTVFAHKSANTARGENLDYCGLEASDDLYLLTASMSGLLLEDAASRLYGRLHALQGVMERGSTVPSVLVIDQVNQGLVAANKAERYVARSEEESPFPHLEETYKDDLATILVDGREKLVKAWVVGHANTNEALGLSHQIKENVFYVGLGRDGIYSAVVNPLKDDRFIGIATERKALTAQLQEYLSAHDSYGNPVNVVLAITNCGSQGWRLVVLPQLPEPEPITLGVTNPPASPLPMDTVEAEETDTPSGQRTPAPLSIEEMRTVLDTQLNAATPEQHYTAEQKQTALSFIRWIKTHRHDFVDAQGLLDPESVSYAFDGVQSAEQMELILQLITDLGYGTFEEHPYTGYIAWRLKGVMPIFTPEEQPPLTPPAPEDKTTAETLEPLPIGISEEKFETILFYLSQKQPNSLLTPNGFLTGCHRLIDKDSHLKTSTAEIRIVLKYLDILGIVAFPDKDDKQFKIMGFPDKPS